jgi:hypothetical protein
MRVMGQQQPRGGKIFLVDGQGSNGRATPKNAAYGATKAALVQLKVAEQVPVCCAVLCCSAVACRLRNLGCGPCCSCRWQHHRRLCRQLTDDPWRRSVDCRLYSHTAGVPRGASARQQHLGAPGVPRHGRDRPAGRKRQVSWLSVSKQVAFFVAPNACLAIMMQSHVERRGDHAVSSQLTALE